MFHKRKGMEFNLTMPKTLRPYYLQKVSAYQSCVANGNFAKAWAHLELAHILG